MKNTLYVLILLISILGCNSAKKISDVQKNTSFDGSSFEKAIVINKSSESEGISAEYDWLKKNYPNYQNLGQSLMYHDKKPYDVLKIKTEKGETKDIYFDISKFFGKF